MVDTPLGPGGTPPVTTPPTPKPLYPDTPWWASLAAVLITAVVSVLGTAYALGKRPGDAGLGSAGLPPAASLLVDTVTYFPHILLLFGVLADMFTYDGVWSIPSLVGLISIFMNYIMQYFWFGIQSFITTSTEVASRGSQVMGASAAPAAQAGGAGVPGSFFKNYDGCSVQGFEGFKIEFAPQTLVVTATIFFYYIFDLVRNRGWINSAAAIMIFGTIYIGQVAILATTATDGRCGNTYGNNAQALMAMFEGLVFGGSAYGIVQTWYPTRLPTSTISPFPRRSKNDLVMGPDGKMYDSDGYPYVVLPNGQTAPDLSSPASKNAFAALASTSTGGKPPATPPGCSVEKPAMAATCPGAA